MFNAPGNCRMHLTYSTYKFADLRYGARLSSAHSLFSKSNIALAHSRSCQRANLGAPRATHNSDNQAIMEEEEEEDAPPLARDATQTTRHDRHRTGRDNVLKSSWMHFWTLAHELNLASQKSMAKRRSFFTF